MREYLQVLARQCWIGAAALPVFLCLLVPCLSLSAAQIETQVQSGTHLPGEFRWKLGPPLVSAAQGRADLCYSVKDPSVVFYQNRWHLFCTIRSRERSHQIDYLSFADWAQANSAPRRILSITNGYFCAPEVFYFAPQQRWYLIYQVLDPTRKVALQPAFSTCSDVTKPELWSPPALLFPEHPTNVKGWIDFWVICDEANAFLFFTSNDGRMWRAQTALSAFPFGWTIPKVVLQADIFEASHTYKLRGSGNYLTIVESVGQAGRRYYKAYLAERLDGAWTPLADSPEKPFASRHNLHPQDTLWTDSISHGELIRSGFDQELEVEPTGLRFLFQGVSDAARAGKKYGEIPWQIGLLDAAW